MELITQVTGINTGHGVLVYVQLLHHLLVVEVGDAGGVLVDVDFYLGYARLDLLGLPLQPVPIPA
jgi:hypothetical protein